VELTEAAWTFRGSFKDGSVKFPWGAKISSRKQSARRPRRLSHLRARACNCGRCSQEGGRADVFLDGREGAAKIDAWIPRIRAMTTIGTLAGCGAANDSVRIGDPRRPDARSTGTKLQIELLLSMATHCAITKRLCYLTGQNFCAGVLRTAGEQIMNFHQEVRPGFSAARQAHTSPKKKLIRSGPFEAHCAHALRA